MEDCFDDVGLLPRRIAKANSFDGSYMVVGKHTFAKPIVTSKGM